MFICNFTRTNTYDCERTIVNFLPRIKCVSNKDEKRSSRSRVICILQRKMTLIGINSWQIYCYLLSELSGSSQDVEILVIIFSTVWPLIPLLWQTKHFIKIFTAHVVDFKIFDYSQWGKVYFSTFWFRF